MRNIEVKNYRVPGKTKTDITLIGDLHYTKNMSESFLSGLLKEINKDDNTVCFVGDILHEASIVTDEEAREKLENFLKELSEKHNVKIILGNHDIMSKKDNVWKSDLRAVEFFKDLEKDSQITFLNNTINVELNTNNSYYGINPGVEFYENKTKKEDKLSLLKKLRDLRYMRETLEEELLSSYKQSKILLIHSPYLADDKVIKEELKEYDLVLAGHMHNGLVPSFLDDEKNDGIISPYKEMFCDNARGYKILSDNSHLIITGGLTKIAGDSNLQKFLNNLYPVSIDKIAIRKDAKKLTLCKN